MKIGKVVKYCVFGFIGVCVIYNPELLPGALCYASLYGVVRYVVRKKKRSKEIQAQQSMKPEVPSQPVQKLQESVSVQRPSGIEFSRKKLVRETQEPDEHVDVTLEAFGKPTELPIQDSKKGIEWARQKLASRAQESEEQVAATPEVVIKPEEVQPSDPKKGIEWARQKLCKEVSTYDEQQDSIFSSDLDIDLIAATIETKPVAGADGIAYARSILTSDVDECADEPDPVKYEDGIGYARSLLSRNSGVVKEEPKPVREPEEPEPVGGAFSVMERDVESCKAVAAFLRAYYSLRYNLV